MCEVYAMQHPDQNACNIHLKHLQHMQHVQRPDLLLQHPYKSTCNVPIKHLKHLKTYAFSVAQHLFTA
jgi:hypothetical protein